jgi:penicillin-binding protein 1A
VFFGPIQNPRTIERPSNLYLQKVDCYVPKKVVDTTAVEQDTEEFEL